MEKNQLESELQRENMMHFFTRVPENGDYNKDGTLFGGRRLSVTKEQKLLKT